MYSVIKSGKEIQPSTQNRRVNESRARCVAAKASKSLPFCRTLRKHAPPHLVSPAAQVELSPVPDHRRRVNTDPIPRRRVVLLLAPTLLRGFRPYLAAGPVRSTPPGRIGSEPVVGGRSGNVDLEIPQAVGPRGNPAFCGSTRFCCRGVFPAALLPRLGPFLLPRLGRFLLPRFRRFGLRLRRRIRLWRCCRRGELLGSLGLRCVLVR